MTINLAQLKAFTSVATIGSFTQAAASLNVSQSNLSMQVGTLETHYNVKLLERKRGEVKPTPIGHELLEIAKQLFLLQDEAATLIANANQFDKGTLRIGSDSPVTVFPHLNTFKQEYPTVTTSLYLGSAEEVLKALKTYQVDVAIVSNKASEHMFDSISIKQSGLACVFLNDHILSKKKCVSFKELKNHPLIMRMEGSQTRAVFDAASKLADFTASVSLEVSSREGVLEAVLHQIGVGVIWEQEFNNDPRLKVVPLDVEGGMLSAYLVIAKDRERRGILRAFMNIVND